MLNIRQHNDEWSCFAETPTREGRCVYMFSPTYVPIRDKYTIEVNGKHFMDDMGKFLNHSCKPNSRIVSEDGFILLYAITDIDIGDEVTFDYNSTESNISNPFVCNCCGNSIGDI